MAIHVGTCGWSYAHWENVLYPPGTRSTARLELYTGRFGTAELNASFYRWPPDRTFASWRRTRAYFNNDLHGYAVRNAESLRALLEHRRIG